MCGSDLAAADAVVMKGGGANSSVFTALGWAEAEANLTSCLAEASWAVTMVLDNVINDTLNLADIKHYKTSSSDSVVRSISAHEVSEVQDDRQGFRIQEGVFDGGLDMGSSS
jgi:hypothetical protein